MFLKSDLPCIKSSSLSLPGIGQTELSFLPKLVESCLLRQRDQISSVKSATVLCNAQAWLHLSRRIKCLPIALNFIFPHSFNFTPAVLNILPSLLLRVVCRSQFAPAGERRLLNIQKFCEPFVKHSRYRIM